MKIKRFFAADMRQAIRKVERELGPEAVILSNKKVMGGIELVAALDFDEAAFKKQQVASNKQTEPTLSPSPARALLPPQGEGRDGGGVRTAAQNISRAQHHPHPPIKSGASSNPPLEGEGMKSSPRADTNYWSQDPALAQIRSELNDLRGLLERQLGGLAWGDEARRHPARARIVRDLSALGMSAAVCRSIAERVPEEMNAASGWGRALENLTHDIAVAEENSLERGGVVALVGPTGVGKTTTIAKLAARYALRHGRKRVALVTLDNYRIGAHEQLRTYGRIMDVPVYTVKSAEELRGTLEDLCDKELVLIDTAGISHRDPRIHDQFAILNAAQPHIKNYLVLSSTTEYGGLHDITKIYTSLSLQGCVLTKLDETAQLGGALSAAMSHRLPLVYFTDGQRVPEDIHIARANVLVQRALALALHSSPASVNEQSLENVLRGSAVNANV